MAIQQTFEFLAEPATPPTASAQPRLRSPAQSGGQPRSGAAVAQPLAAGREPSASATVEPSRMARALPQNSQRNHVSQLDQLRAQVGCINTVYRSTESATEEDEKLSTGSTAIDGLLPAGGLRTDAITEWVAEDDGCGAAALSMVTAAHRLQQVAGPLVVVCPPDYFYPPAAVALGVPANRIIWVRPTRHADTVWAIDQALRCQATAAVWGPLAARLDDRDARRFQLAAEIGKTPGLLIRPAAVRGRPTFADIRFHIDNEVAHSTRAMRVTLDRCRGGQIGRSVVVQINDQASIERHQDDATPLHLASQLANPQRTGQQRQQRRA